MEQRPTPISLSSEEVASRRSSWTVKGGRVELDAAEFVGPTSQPLRRELRGGPGAEGSGGASHRRHGPPIASQQGQARLDDQRRESG
eukprot:28970-Pyramimonas_sp.AAC.1